ncbi:MAG TPA: prephenate dehydratase [Spirochaetota bacterium]|nr:prephenate dehydratase [Spirochaetota bacterium]HOM38613.1 prephenate dehydratase [Spirochaetota bacterium]HPQ49750.1 prephenate dehydratase [Spirochaetota bacterium]
MKRIEELREKIDEIDNKIIELLDKRAFYAKEIGKIKKELNLPIYSPEREISIFKRIEEITKNNKNMPTNVIKQIYKEIISYTRALEKSIKVGFLGPEASYTHQAAIENFGTSVEHISFSTIDDIFKSVYEGKIEYGVVPIENSYNGVVFRTMDMLIEFDVYIIGEIYLRIKHCLLSKCKNIKEIKKLYAHSQSIEQCKIFINKNIPNVIIEETSSNSAAVLKALNDEESAAIASSIASQVYDINILEFGIEDSSDNTTRFIIIGKESIQVKEEKSKTSIIISVINKPGILFSILKEFADRSINLTKIESRPSKKKAWDYIFFIDFEGNIRDEKIKEVISKIKEKTVFTKILGSYPLGGIF